MTKQIISNYNFALVFMLIFIMTLSGCGGGGDGGASGGGTGGDGGSSATTSNWSSTITEINQAIAADPDADWVAGETSVTQNYTPDQCKVLCGAEPETSEPVIVEDRSDSRELPERFEWNNIDDKNWMTPVRNQGAYSTCVSFATLGVMEAMFNIQNNTPSQDTNFSEWYLWANGKGVPPELEGWKSSSALSFLYNSGTVAESACYYSDIPNYTAPPDGATIYKITGYTLVDPTITAIKTALMKGPLVTRMTVFKDFYAYKKQAAVNSTYRHVWGDEDGGHAIILVGWAKNSLGQLCWLFKNSWDTNWGNDGYFYVTMQDCNAFDCMVNLGCCYSISGVTSTTPVTTRPIVTGFTASPENLPVDPEGSSYTFSVSVSGGKPPYTVTWFMPSTGGTQQYKYGETITLQYNELNDNDAYSKHVPYTVRDSNGNSARYKKSDGTYSTSFDYFIGKDSHYTVPTTFPSEP
ncbi:MAG: C1 family peptidase [Candidatus Xenobiia bacterium LiM19]